MAEFSERLSLDISQALRDVDRMEAAITSAATRFRTELARSIDQLRDVRIEVTADASTLTRSVQSALDAADTSVRVTGETESLTREVSQAVERADTEATVTADTSQAQREVERLDTSARTASSGIFSLRNALAALSATAIIQGVRALADASSALEEQVSGADVVFGDAAASVLTFADQATRIGLAEDAALRSSNAFGLLAQSAGLAEDAATGFATALVERGADIASLRDLDLTETLNALRSGLVGETEPLRNLGIFLNEATVQARALELGLGDANGVISDAEKIQARYSLILEQSSIAAGNFALTADGLANTQRTLAAEARNAAATVGASFQPELIRLLDAGRDLLPLLVDLGTTALPALVSIAADLAPAFGGGLTVLQALAPLLQLTAEVVDAIPEPLLAMVGAFGLLSASVGPSIGFLSRFTSLIPQTAASSSLLTGTLLPLTAGLIGYAEIQREAAEREAERTATIAELNRALDAGSSLQESLTSALQSATREDANFRRGLKETGVSIDAFSDAVFGGGGLRGALEDLNSLTAESVDLSFDEIVALGNQAQALQEGVDARLEYIANLEDSNQALVDAAIAHHTLADGSVDSAAALDEVNDSLAAQEAVAQRVVDRFGPIVGQFVGVAEAMGRVSDAAPSVATAVRGLRGGAGDTEVGFLNLAIAIDDATLSEEQLGDVASLVGVNLSDLEGFVEGVTGALEDFVSTAVGQLPTVSSVFADTLANAQSAAGDFGASLREDADAQAQALIDAADTQAQGVIDAASSLADSVREADPLQAEALQRSARDSAEAIRDAARDAADAVREGAADNAEEIAASARVTAEGLTLSLLQATGELGDFRQDLAAIANAGFSDLAGVIAQQGPEVGGQLADELEEALLAGNTTLLEGLSAANTAFVTESNQTVDFIHDTLAPRLIIESGLLGAALTESFGEGLDFEERIRIAAALASSSLDEEGQAIAAVAAAEGEEAARQYGEALDLEQATIDAGVAAGIAIQNNAPVDAAREAGRATSAGFAEGVAGGGEAAAAALAFEFEARLRTDLKILSPSKVAMDLGAFVGEGFALGIEGSRPRVQSAADRLIALGRVNTANLVPVGSPSSTASGFDDSRLLDALGRLTGNGVNIGQVSFSGLGSPAQGLDELRREMRARQFRGA